MSFPRHRRGGRGRCRGRGMRCIARAVQDEIEKLVKDLMESSGFDPFVQPEFVL